MSPQRTAKILRGKVVTSPSQVQYLTTALSCHNVTNWLQYPSAIEMFFEERIAGHANVETANAHIDAE